MTSASQAAHSPQIDAPPAHGHAHLPTVHAPSPGATATLIHDLRELFKVKVVGLVLVTGWGGYYLGSLAVRHLQHAARPAGHALGIGLVSAGAGA